MADPEYIAVRYERNADNRATGAIRFHDDDREDIAIGGTGLVTQQELNNLIAGGLIFDVLEGDQAKQVHEETVTSASEPDLEDLQVEDLRDIAADEGVDLSGKTRKGEIVSAIREARAGVQSGAESLPATATRTSAPAISGAGGAAGPEGAAGAPGTSGGGPAT